MPTSAASWPLSDAAIYRSCTRCGQALSTTTEDELECPRCGRVKAWTVRINGVVVAAGRMSLRGGIGIWLAGKLEDLRPASAREPAASCSGWNEES